MNNKQLSIEKAFIILAATVSFITAGLFIYGRYNRPEVNISGSWEVTFAVDSSAMPGIIGKRMTDLLYFRQENDRIMADGSMVRIDNVLLPDHEKVPLHFEGRIKGEKIEISFIQQGATKHVGQIKVAITLDGDKMEGTFAGKGQSASGKVIATRIR